MKSIVITITPKGEAIVTTKGFAGAACQDASRVIEAALGQKTTEVRTAEFYQTPDLQQDTRHLP